RGNAKGVRDDESGGETEQRREDQDDDDGATSRARGFRDELMFRHIGDSSRYDRPRELASVFDRLRGECFPGSGDSPTSRHTTGAVVAATMRAANVLTPVSQGAAIA